MNTNNQNSLIVIENGQLNMYCLDDRQTWEVGRGSPDFRPDIRLHTATVSRKHGKFQNVDGCWCYIDYYGKNGTMYNNRPILRGLGKRIRPVMPEDGSIFLFGSRESCSIGNQTVWAMFSTQCGEESWRAADTRNTQVLAFSDGNHVLRLEKPEKGTVIRQNHGVGIYMGDITYLYGATQLV